MAKTGRGRNYAYQLDDSLGIYAHQMAVIEEQTLRVQDLISGLPADICNRPPDWGDNSIYFLAMHMAGAEDHWLSASSEAGTPTRRSIDKAGRFTLGGIQEYTGTVRKHTLGLVRSCVRDEGLFKETKQFASLTSVLDHVVWHWIYHSGQVGLLRRFFRKRYTWQFGGKGEPV
jgi:uncharacterized damage-inducible protein DinB